MLNSLIIFLPELRLSSCPAHLNSCPKLEMKTAISLKLFNLLSSNQHGLQHSDHLVYIRFITFYQIEMTILLFLKQNSAKLAKIHNNWFSWQKEKNCFFCDELVNNQFFNFKNDSRKIGEFIFAINILLTTC